MFCLVDVSVMFKVILHMSLEVSSLLKHNLRVHIIIICVFSLCVEFGVRAKLTDYKTFQI